MLESEVKKHLAAFKRSRAKWNPGRLGDRADWLELLLGTYRGASLNVEVMKIPLAPPPESHVWRFTSGVDARGDVDVDKGAAIQRAQAECAWLIEDLSAARALLAYRSRDLAEAWLSITSGDRIGSLAGMAIARALFEVAIEAERVAGTIEATLSQVHPSSGDLIGFGDGFWVPLFRFLGGEKTKIVSPREATRNVRSNLKWLQQGSTRVLVDDYARVSAHLHAGGGEIGVSSRTVQQAELMLLTSGAQFSLIAYQTFMRATQMMAPLRTYCEELEEFTQVMHIGHDPQLARLPLSRT